MLEKLLKPFYVFTALVVLWDVKMWANLPLWIHLLVAVNLMLAAVLTTWRVLR
ncbi:hypothetical protein [Tumebacillus avium]|uniref:hypothetical protein n=1 Tax=Tumebacillus avium TaxID=1903704 RepID=UPI0012FE69D3|nr:hypothetical protein [Tumebacillus avium]